jgi:hypothetical protein
MHMSYAELRITNLLTGGGHDARSGHLIPTAARWSDLLEGASRID